VQPREENVKSTSAASTWATSANSTCRAPSTELATARAEAIGLQRQRATTEHALAVLLGKPAASFTAAANRWTTALLPVIPAGLPSTLLERRPDIAPAQRAMEAANARIGVARSAMFPALSLNACGGGASDTVAECSSGAAVRGCWAP
jgi:multidrug efflux system outer membrane protein